MLQAPHWVTWGGAVSNNYAALTGTGISTSDLEFSGSAIPQIFGSLTNTLSWRRLELTFTISGKFRYFFRRKPLSYGDLFGTDKKSTADYSKRWQQPVTSSSPIYLHYFTPGDSNRDYFYSNSSTLVEKGDHIRLQFINLSYRFIFHDRKKMPASRAQVFLNGSNLGILWRANDRGIDPDYPVQGIPAPAIFSAGIKINFQ